VDFKIRINERVTLPCRFKTCPQHVHNCQICKNLQHRRCARKVARKLVREQKVKTPCGVSVQLMVCLEESRKDKEECTTFSAASLSEVYVEVGSFQSPSNR
jgi:hypothetical protein